MYYVSWKIVVSIAILQHISCKNFFTSLHLWHVKISFFFNGTKCNKSHKILGCSPFIAWTYRKKNDFLALSQNIRIALKSLFSNGFMYVTKSSYNLLISKYILDSKIQKLFKGHENYCKIPVLCLPVERFWEMKKFLFWSWFTWTVWFITFNFDKIGESVLNLWDQ